MSHDAYEQCEFCGFSATIRYVGHGDDSAGLPYTRYSCGDNKCERKMRALFRIDGIAAWKKQFTSEGFKIEKT